MNKINAFSGFPEAMFEWFMAVSFNNSTEWFEENRQAYEDNVKAPLYAFAAALEPTIRAFDPEMETRPQKVVSRIRRDTRFSRSKLPYRDYMWISHYKQGADRNACLSLFFSISCMGVDWGMGWYGGSPARAKATRACIQRRSDDFLALVADPAFTSEYTMHGDSYRRVDIPAGLPEALVPYYVSKGMYWKHEESAGKQLLQADFAAHVGESFLRLKPLYEFFCAEGLVADASIPETRNGAKP